MASHTRDTTRTVITRLEATATGAAMTQPQTKGAPLTRGKPTMAQSASTRGNANLDAAIGFKKNAFPLLISPASAKRTRPAELNRSWSFSG